MATTRSHVAFQLWAQRDRLIMLDFDPSVVAVASRPFCLEWTSNSGAHRRVPDYFARSTDRTAVVIDVRPGSNEARATDVAVVADAADQAGWSYRVLDRPDPTLIANVRWLAGYRHPRCSEPSLIPAIRAKFATSCPLVAGIADLGDPLAVRPTLFHLLWTGTLLADLQSSLLHAGTALTSSPIGSP